MSYLQHLHHYFTNYRDNSYCIHKHDIENLYSTRICPQVKLNGKTYYVHMSYLDYNNDIVGSITQPLYINDEIKNANRGVYTWVIVIKPDNTPIIFYTPSHSIYEFGSKHSHLLETISKNFPDLIDKQGKICILYAGELDKNEKEYTYNLQSGTYMFRQIIPFRYNSYYSVKRSIDTITDEEIINFEKDVLQPEFLYIIDNLVVNVKNIFSSQEEESFISASGYIKLDYLDKLSKFITIKLFSKKKHCTEYQKYRIELDDYDTRLIEFKNRLKSSYYHRNPRQFKYHSLQDYIKGNPLPSIPEFGVGTDYNKVRKLS